MGGPLLGRVGDLLPAILLALLVLLASGLVAGCDREVEISPPKAAPDTSAQRAEQAQEALDRFVRAVQGGSREDAVALAPPRSRRLLGWVHDNARALRIGGLSMRYVDESAQLDAREQARLGQDEWRGSVHLEYRYSGLDETPARMETGVVFVPTGEGVRIASFGGTGLRTPLWLTDRLSVVRTPETLLAVAGGTSGRYPGLVSRALRQVRHVFPKWRGPLLVEVPHTRSQLDAALLSNPGEYDNIAAVTTTVDGSLARDAPVRVFVNPTVFDKLKQRGAQVVMSHEATHVETGATFTSMPTWLLEGFADFVALDGAGVPVDMAAGQILGRIRKHGLPRELPTSQDLDPKANGLGATYEEAWLACRFLAEEYGTDRLVRFYGAVSAGAATEEAFRSELDTTEQGFVTRWRADLARLAGVTP